MRSLLTLAAYAALIVSVQAQNEIEPETQISLAKGQIKVLQFDESVSRVHVVIKGIVEAEPLTDRQLSIAGVNPGGTRLVVFAQNGRQIYNASVTVTPELGRIVKIYGLNKDDDIGAGYTAIWCHEMGCGRPDIDLPRPNSITVERIRSNVSRGR